ncbi:MAG: J domain-containing protein [Verrucomicrobiae bacterium]|nr:J domain-containing protein [Verrucomicrobiae bacterium]
MSLNVIKGRTDPYGVLGLPRTFYLDLNAIEEAFRRSAALHHPDQAGGSTASFHELQEAATILRDPAKRLRYLASAPETSSIPLPAAATALFPTIVTQLQYSDVLLKKYQATQGSLAKAIMIDELVNTRLKINEVLSSVQQWQDDLAQKLRDLDTGASETSPQELLELANSFSFAQRWNQQLRERELMLTTLLG